MSVYFGSDWHFSKEAKNGKPFRYNISKNELILKNYRDTVKDDDIFVFLGDLTYIGDDNPIQVQKQIEQIKLLPGKKIFIKGNNDYMDLDFYINELGFDISKEIIKMNNVYLSHIPMKIKNNEINIHGHIHGARNYWKCESKNHVDAFSKVYGYRPVELRELLYGNYSFIKKKLLTNNLLESINRDFYNMF